MGYYAFYVLGHALDEKVDMYVQQHEGWSNDQMDTLTMDADHRTDFAIGMPEYRDPETSRATGTVFYIHGSDKKPVHPNPQFSRVLQSELPGLSPAYIAAAQHGIVVHTGLSTCLLTVTDLLGQTPLSEELHREQEFPLPSGFYLVRIREGDSEWTSKIVLD